MSIILQSSGGGQITISEPATASNFTQTLPAATGTVQVSGNMPAFSAFQSSSQTLSSSTTTKLNFQTEEWDTANCFDSTTNMRFTPNVAGYYTVNAAFQVASSFTTGNMSIFKNGSLYKQGISTGGVAGTTGLFSVACQVYLNGSTDYIEAYGFISNGQALVTGSGTTYFQACLIRAA